MIEHLIPDILTISAVESHDSSEIIFTARQQSCRKVMFWQTGVQGGGPHVTITHDALDITVQAPRP